MDCLLTEGEVSIVVGDTLGKVEVALDTLAFRVEQSSAEYGNLTIALDGEVDVLGRVGEVLTIPEEGA